MRLNLSIKIPLLVAAAALAAGIAVASVEYGQTSRELRGAAEAKLLALLEARAIAIGDYLASIQRDLRSQAANPFVVEALSSFLVGHQELGASATERLRALYVANNPYPVGERQRLDHPNDPSIFSLAHIRFHPQLRDFAVQYGYRDLLLLDLAGNVVYSVMKQADFATNLIAGPYKDSGLARAFSAINGTMAGEVFVDFTIYAPSGGAPTGFIAAPVFGEAHTLIGVLVFEMPVDRINAVMQVAAGLGETGETIIVGPDLLMRSDSRFAAETTILKRRVAIGSIGKALAGESGLEVSREPRADAEEAQVLVAFRPLDYLGVRWAVAAKADLDEVLAPVRAMRDRAIMNALAITALVVALGMLATRFVVVRPLSEVMQTLRALTAGQRDVRVAPRPRRDEIGDIGRALELYRTGLIERDRLAEDRRREAVLLESAQRFRVIAQAQPVPVMIFRTLDGALVYQNPAAVALLDLEPEAGRSTGASELFADPEDWSELVHDAARPGGFDYMEKRVRRANGEAFPVSLSGRSIDYDGAACVVVGMLDLTEREAAQREIERQREMIYQREKLGALGSLLAGVAHELNNPLSIVVAQATLLEDLAPDPKVAERGQKIRAAAERCARIVKTFLAMARQRPPSRTAVDLNKAAHAAIELLGYGLRTAGVDVHLELSASLPSVWADADQINQVLTNLIVNAQQAMVDSGPLRRLTVRTEADAAADMVTLCVADTGPGVPAAIKLRIFEPFFTTKPVGVGTGVGLSVCHGIVSAHGGSIGVEDMPGGGARFIVRLPIGRPVEKEDSTASLNPKAALGKRLLVVDDEIEIAKSLAEMLERSGYRVDIATSGQAALARIAAQNYEAVISDIRMPDMDGTTLYRRLKDIRPALAGRFIVVTGDTLSGAVSAFLDETGLPCIEKPFDPTDVHRLVAATLEPREAGAGSQPDSSGTKT